VISKTSRNLQEFFRLDITSTDARRSGSAVTGVLRVFAVPFSHGTHRATHWALLNGKRFVAKRYIGDDSPAQKESMMQEARENEVQNMQRKPVLLSQCCD